MTIEDIPAVDRALKREYRAHRAPIIELIEAQTHDPFAVLVGTILSARTKDACTAGAVRRLFAAGGNTPEGLEQLPRERIEELIYPVGFFRDKARHLKALPGKLREKFAGVLPKSVEELCELPGVGRKTANLTVHTRKYVETEMKLGEILPVKYWKTWNSHLVSFGQTRCDPVRPQCSGCPIARFCHSPKKTTREQSPRR